MNTIYSLSQLGWQPFYQQQLTLEEYEHSICARVINHHRSEYIVQTNSEQVRLPIHANLPMMTVGDWLLLDQNQQFKRLLERKTLLSRKGAGAEMKLQHITSNIDTLFVVMSLNQDFNLNRLERYLTLAHDAQVEPVVILSKSDLCQDVAEKVIQVQALDPLLEIVAINGLESCAIEQLQPWCKSGKTVSFVGSSGVGKSTLINQLVQDEVALTNDIRQGDDKGKHTTTSRSVYISAEHGVIIDTPGMRELQLVGSEESLHTTFADIEQLASHCRFSDCQHQDEPNCAVQRAIDGGELDTRRFKNYQKLLREQAFNHASLREKREKERQFGKLIRQVTRGKKQLKKMS
ncbi:ribosome small subunit-dependent GTPase A [Thalassotalea marina]|uniref:Small ribosomal subunit biogenesis GTPase RsgA n=1 Tax=Thalassotalea marina TaxID=1673741 RepID=A0A919B9Z4_9GAMM|nr:ribosome small subunit-dependent GTPase A [Thalassotalea marina]GHF77913.1 putative ribosome biogenesis GTPase RsgA 2 [Thalassotalea marina]